MVVVSILFEEGEEEYRGMSCLHFGDVDPPRDFYTTDQRTNEPTVTQQLSLVHTSNGSSVLFVWLYATRRSTLETIFGIHIFT